MALQTVDRRPSARTTGVSARPVGAGHGAGRDRPLRVRRGEEPSEELAADSAPRKRRPKNRRAGSGPRPPASSKASASRQIIFLLVLLITLNTPRRSRRPCRPESAAHRPGPPTSPPARSAPASVGAGIGRWGPPGRRAERGASRRSRAPETPSERGRAGSDRVPRRQPRCRPPAQLYFPADFIN